MEIDTFIEPMLADRQLRVVGDNTASDRRVAAITTRQHRRPMALCTTARTIRWRHVRIREGIGLTGGRILGIIYLLYGIGTDNWSRP